MHEPIRQVAYVTRDARAAAETHSRLFGSGPFLLMENEQRLVCRGKETHLQHIAAFGQWGSQMIEFFQPVKASTPEMEELIAAPPSGAQFHHVALLVKDLEATVLRFSTAGFPDVLRATIPNTSIETAWIDTRAGYGHLVEAYSAEPELIAFYEMIANASVGFQGDRPVRENAL